MGNHGVTWEPEQAEGNRGTDDGRVSLKGPANMIITVWTTKIHFRIPRKGADSMEKIRLAIVGVGNCASSLIQGIEYYQTHEGSENLGLMHYDLGGYQPGDMEVVAAFDIDKRKVGKPSREAIYALPNCTKIIIPQVSNSKTMVSMGHVLDGVSDHMREYPETRDLWSPMNHPAMWKKSCGRAARKSC